MLKKLHWIKMFVSAQITVLSMREFANPDDIYSLDTYEQIVMDFIDRYLIDLGYSAKEISAMSIYALARWLEVQIAKSAESHWNE